MKKIIALLLVLVLSLGLFAGCAEQGNTTTTAGAAGSVKDAKDYLYAMYKDSSVAVVRDFSRVAVVAINGVSYKVTWTADVAEDLVKITATDTMATIDINEKPTEDVNFTLTATVEDAEGNKETVTFTHSIAAVATTGTLFVETFEVGTAYKFALQQNAIEGCPILYFTGEKSGNYLATSTNPMDAVDVIVEETDGGYYLTFLDGETKKYINITTYTKDDGTVSKTQDIGTEPTCVYKWDAERKTFTAEIADLGTFYLGTYSSYNTISASDVKYIENLEVIGASQFPAGLCTITAETVEKPETGKAYLFGLQQNAIDGCPVLYFTGEKSGNYLATSTSMKDAVRVYIEETEGGYHLFFYAGGTTKTYINITTYTKDDGTLKNTQDIGTEPTCVYTWDAERMTFTASLGDLGTFYLGTYSTYNTISSSNTSYIENMEVIGVSQFPAGLFDLGLPVEEVEPNEGDDNNGDNNTDNNTGDDVSAILDAAFALADGESMAETVTLTGEIISLKDYNEQYGDRNLTIKVQDKEIYCYALKGDVKNLQVGDTITVTGTIKNYKGTIEFDKAQLVSGGSSDSTGGNDTTTDAQLPTVTAPEAGKAYKFGIIQVTNGHTVYITGAVSTRYLETTEDKTAALDVFVEADGEGFKFYFEKDGAKQYMELYLNDEGKQALRYSENGTTFFFDETISAWCAELEGTTYYVGSYSNFDTLSASKTSYIDEENKGVSQFPAGFFEA